jgi:hypothetical protein
MLKTSYFTLGQDHAHRYGNITLDKDVVIKITAEDPRQRMFDLFGQKWAFEYHSIDEIELKYYPRGIYDVDKLKKVLK